MLIKGIFLSSHQIKCNFNLLCGFEFIFSINVSVGWSYISGARRINLIFLGQDTNKCAITCNHTYVECAFNIWHLFVKKVYQVGLKAKSRKWPEFPVMYYYNNKTIMVVVIQIELICICLIRLDGHSNWFLGSILLRKISKWPHFPRSINPVTSVTVHPPASCIVYRFYIDVFIVGHIPQLILVLFLFETNIPIKTS